MEMSHTYYYILFSILCFDGTLYLICFLGPYMALKTEVASQKPAFGVFFLLCMFYRSVLKVSVIQMYFRKVHCNANKLQYSCNSL